MLDSGSQIGPYEVESWLGSGAVASVYSVRHRMLGTRHAVKVLALGGEELQTRLVRAGARQRALKHPNVVAVDDVFLHGPEPVLLMELVEGPMLGDLLHVHRLTVDEALGIFGGILAGVSSGHRLGIVHRNLTPDNVLLHVSHDALVPKVAGFGVHDALDPGGANRTHTGIPLGLPSYMAPEQMKDGSSASVASDVFSLGCILYYLVTGQRCFDGGDIVTLVQQMVAGRYRDPGELVPGLPPEVSAAIRRATAADSQQRFASCEEFSDFLFGEAAPTTVDIRTEAGTAAVRLHVDAQADRISEAVTTRLREANTAERERGRTEAVPTVGDQRAWASVAVALAAILAVGLVAAAAVLGTLDAP